MINSDNGLTVTDVIKSMKREGFSYEEIYDTLSGAGVKSDDLQILFDRIEEELEGMNFASRKSRLSREVEEIFELKLKNLKIELDSKFRILDSKVESAKEDLERLGSLLMEIRNIQKSS